MMNHLKYNITAFLAVLLLTLAGCQSEDVLTENQTDDKSTILNIHIPQLADTRADEGSMLQEKNLEFYIKQDNKEIESTFVSFTKSEAILKIPFETRGKITVIVKHIPKDENNANVIDIDDENIITHSDNINPKLRDTYYGETTHDLSEGNSVQVNLICPIAEVKIEIDRSCNKDNTHEIKSIESIRIYRVNNRSYLHGDMQSANIPEGTEKILGKEESINDYTEYYTEHKQGEEKILVSESKAPSKRDEATAVVVGVKLNNVEDKVYYYRLDFAKYNESSLEKYLPILRNHIYVFNLNTVKDLGETTPEDALNAKTLVTVEFEKWVIEKYDSSLHGDYYFGIDQKVIELGGKKGSETRIPFRSNISTILLNKIADYKVNKEPVSEDSPINISVTFEEKTDSDEKELVITNLKNFTQTDYKNSKLNMQVLKQKFTFPLKMKLPEKIYWVDFDDYKNGSLSDQGACKIFRESDKNFSLAKDATVYTEPFKANDTHTGTYHYTSDIKDVNTRIKNNKCDILLMNPTNNSNEIKEAVENCLEKGGVVIFLSGHSGSSNTITKSVLQMLFDKNPNSTIETHDITSSDNSPHIFNSSISEKDDPIMNGSFGTLTFNTNYWGTGSRNAQGIKGLKSDDLVLYSKYVGKKEDYKNDYMIFRHKTKNFILIGDLKFISYDKTFGLDDNKKPIGKEYKNKTVYNSVFFGNVMAWAIDQVQNNKQPLAKNKK